MKKLTYILTILVSFLIGCNQNPNLIGTWITGSIDSVFYVYDFSKDKIGFNKDFNYPFYLKVRYTHNKILCDSGEMVFPYNMLFSPDTIVFEKISEKLNLKHRYFPNQILTLFKYNNISICQKLFSDKSISIDLPSISYPKDSDEKMSIQIFVGKPKNKLQKKFGQDYLVQINDLLVNSSNQQIKEFIAGEYKNTITVFSDKNVPMVIIDSLRSNLEQSIISFGTIDSSLQINYLETGIYCCDCKCVNYKFLSPSSEHMICKHKPYVDLKTKNRIKIDSSGKYYNTKQIAKNQLKKYFSNNIDSNDTIVYFLIEYDNQTKLNDYLYLVSNVKLVYNSMISKKNKRLVIYDYNDSDIQIIKQKKQTAGNRWLP